MSDIHASHMPRVRRAAYMRPLHIPRMATVGAVRELWDNRLMEGLSLRETIQ